MVLHTRGRVGRRHFTTSLETRKRLGALLRLDGGEGLGKGMRGDRTTRLNFVLTDRSDTGLNFDFLRNTIFVLDYDRREIRIKQ